MSALTDRLADEHLPVPTRYTFTCLCGRDFTGAPVGSQRRHVAEVTEAAVRAQIAADIRSVQNGGLGDYALGRAADIAEGGTR